MMTDDQLSRADKIRIRRAVESLADWQTANPDAPDVMEMGRTLANILRSEMPDLDAVGMGRMCMSLAEYLDMTQEGLETKCPVVEACADHMRAAGFDLTAVEWEERP